MNTFKDLDWDSINQKIIENSCSIIGNKLWKKELKGHKISVLYVCKIFGQNLFIYYPAHILFMLIVLKDFKDILYHLDRINAHAVVRNTRRK